ncbi:ABC transporter permease [Acrocarpospora sp. B8E8]|uniref:ABC transporter permease n=1 Tax=Acrocarpospora sp. B8E8 TaxID=3153572 RepID=UPI00325C8020
MDQTTTLGTPRATGGNALLSGWEYRSIWAAAAGVFVLSALVAPRSLSSSSVLSLLSFSAVLIVVSVGQTLVVQQRGIDLSVPGAVTLCAMVPPLLISKTGVTLAVALVGTLLIGACVGLVNGLLVTKAGITPLITTLAVNSLLLGVLLTYSGGLPSVAAPPALVSFATHQVLGVPLVFWAAVCFVAVVAFGVGSTVLGRRFVAAGVNPAAAKSAGVPVDRYVIGAYVFGSMSAALAAILLLGYLESASVRIGNDYLFASISAVVLGGTSLAGGKGSVVASGVAAVFLTQLTQLLLTAGAPTSIQLLAQAVAIGLAVCLRTLAGAGARRTG